MEEANKLLIQENNMNRIKIKEIQLDNDRIKLQYQQKIIA